MGQTQNEPATKYIWIDQRIDLDGFLNDYYKVFKNNECLRYNNVDTVIRILIEDKSLVFRETIIIISGRLFHEFYKKFNHNINEIKIAPIVVVFCIEKEKFIDNLRFNDININKFSFNESFVFTQTTELSNFINGIKEEKEDINFDEVRNIYELIIPCYYPYLIEDVTQTEINFYNQNIIYNYHEEKKETENRIKTMIKSLKRSNFDYKALISKYWLRIYTIQSTFFSQMNKTLREQKENRIDYEPLIKICYEGVRKKYLNYVIDTKLYRGQKISKKELNKGLLLKLKRDNNEIDKIIIYCRSFLSFSKQKRVAKYFMNRKEPSNEEFKVLLKINGINNKDIDLNAISNASIQQFSEFENEEEILFFPFSCFEVEDIKPKQKDGYYHKIVLNYLGKYGNVIRSQLGDNFFEKIQMNKFSEELIHTCLMKNKNFKSTWIMKKEFKNKYDSLISLLDNKKDCIIKTYNSFSIISLITEKIKLHINFDKIEILSIIKLQNDKICFSTSNKYLQIIELFVNINYINMAIKFQFKLPIEAYNLLYLEGNNNKIIFMNKNIIYCITENKQIYNFNNLTEEETDIIIMKELPNQNIIYLTGNNNITLVHMYNLKNGEKKIISIDKKYNNINNNLVIIKNYCAIGLIYNNVNHIDFIDFKQMKHLFSFELNNILTNMTIFNNDKLMIGLYDDSQNISIIKELSVEFKDEKPNVFVLGEGKIENNTSTEIEKNEIIIINQNNNINNYDNDKSKNNINKNIINTKDNKEKIDINTKISINDYDDDESENNTKTNTNIINTKDNKKKTNINTKININDNVEDKSENNINTNIINSSDNIKENLIKTSIINIDNHNENSNADKIIFDNIQNIIPINDKYILVNTKQHKLIEFKRINEASEIFKESFNKYNNKDDDEKNKLSTIKESVFSFEGHDLKLYNSIKTQPTLSIQNRNKNSDEFEDDLNNYLNIHSSFQIETNNILNNIKQSQIVSEQKEESQIQSNNTINDNLINKNISLEDSKSELNIINEKEDKNEEEKKEKEININNKNKNEVKKYDNKIKNIENKQKNIYHINKKNVNFDFPFACTHQLTYSNSENKIKNKKFLIFD